MSQIWLIYCVETIQKVTENSDRSDAFYMQACRPLIATSEEKARALVEALVELDYREAKCEYALDKECTEPEDQVPFEESEYAEFPSKAEFKTSLTLEDGFVMNMLSELFAAEDLAKIEWWCDRGHDTYNVCIPLMLNQDHDAAIAALIETPNTEA